MFGAEVSGVAASLVVVVVDDDATTLDVFVDDAKPFEVAVAFPFFVEMEEVVVEDLEVEAVALKRFGGLHVGGIDVNGTVNGCLFGNEFASLLLSLGLFMMEMILYLFIRLFIRRLIIMLYVASCGMCHSRVSFCFGLKSLKPETPSLKV